MSELGLKRKRREPDSASSTTLQPTVGDHLQLASKVEDVKSIPSASSPEKSRTKEAESEVPQPSTSLLPAWSANCVENPSAFISTPGVSTSALAGPMIMAASTSTTAGPIVAVSTSTTATDSSVGDSAPRSMKPLFKKSTKHDEKMNEFAREFHQSVFEATRQQQQQQKTQDGKGDSKRFGCTFLDASMISL